MCHIRGSDQVDSLLLAGFCDIRKRQFFGTGPGILGVEVKVSNDTHTIHTVARSEKKEKKEAWSFSMSLLSLVSYALAAYLPMIIRIFASLGRSVVGSVEVTTPPVGATRASEIMEAVPDV